MNQKIKDIFFIKVKTPKLFFIYLLSNAIKMNSEIFFYLIHFEFGEKIMIYFRYISKSPFNNHLILAVI